MTVEKLMKALAKADPKARVLLYIVEKDSSYESYAAKFFTDVEGTPYDGTGAIDDAIESDDGVFVISDWKI